MTETVFRTDDIPTGERFEYWHDLMVNTVCPMEIKSPAAADFQAEMRIVQLGRLVVWPTSLAALKWTRSPHMIRSTDPDYYHLTLPLSGRVDIAQHDHRTVHYRRQMYIVDTYQPFECRNSGNATLGVGLEIPKDLIELPPDTVSRLLAHQISGREGIGAYLADFLTRVAESPSPRPADAVRMGGILTDLLNATLAHSLDVEEELSPAARRQSLALSVKAFIRENLGDPNLTASAVAASHHISNSYLHGMFRGEEKTVSAWIRQLRLDHIRQDLSDPSLLSLPISHIAARWGFTHYTVFCRAFRAAYGVAPRDYRHMSGGATPLTTTVDA
ncbi:AraC family transcriptional regulator [Streptomyces sp. NBC_01429]|uniref:AraC family transcriptional regulator n=1 Tax=Streptomyces sp. NBC_01429 TaxID=2903862 RepID=UPI002E28B44C|nr:AraC family transcriptional regulator [Streptomyces sp. NBC_01429]